MFARRFVARVPAQARSILTLKAPKYTATATATSAGLDSKDLGANLNDPAKLFAMGYASCLIGAIQIVAGRTGQQEMAKNAVVHASVHMGEPVDMEGFGIGVDIKVEGIDKELLKAGYESCPYSRAIKYGAVVNVTLSD